LHEKTKQPLRSARFSRSAKSKPWMKHFGALSKLRNETRRNEKLIDKEFERVNSGEWQ